MTGTTDVPGTPVATGRRPDLDNVKVLLVATVVVVHAVLGYSGFGGWTYADVRETTLAPDVDALFVVLVAPFGLFVISLFFLVAGLLTPGSVDRKGPGRFARDRLVRLGIPFAVFVLAVQPTLVYVVEHPFGGASGSYAEEYLGAERRLDTGPMWFAGVLLVFSLGYAAVRAAGRRDDAAAGDVAGPGPRALWLVCAVVAPAAFAVRLVYPYGSEAGFTDLNLWQWPGSLAAFGLGVVGVRHGWADAVPELLAAHARRVTLAAGAGMTALLVTAGFRDVVERTTGGANAWAAAFTALETLLNVFGPVWLLRVAQHRLARPVRWAGPQVRRGAYAAYVVQGLPLLGTAVVLRPVPVPAEVKAVVVAAVSVVVAFGLGRLVTRLPGVSRVL